MTLKLTAKYAFAFNIVLLILGKQALKIVRKDD